MRILSLWPPHIPSYFNAGHHLPVFMNAVHLRSAGHVVSAVDAGALNLDWKRFGDLIFQGQFDLVAIVNDFDNTDTFDRTTRYIRRLSPTTKIVTAGRLSTQAPAVFASTDVDGFVVSGDPEAGLAALASWFDAGAPTQQLPAGCTVRIGESWHESPRAGSQLAPDDWPLPDTTEIPYAAYEALYERDQNKFCGIPSRRELVVPAARGCPVGCAYCDVPGGQGIRDRRLDVSRVVSYIRDAFAEHPFEYVAFYAPTFTLNRKWTSELCDALNAETRRYPWKCATTIAHLPLALLRRMAEAGCVRVSVGLETLEPDAQGGLPRQKHISYERFQALAGECALLDVELNCFVIAGLPGTTVDGIKNTVGAIKAAGGRVRPTMYADIDLLRNAATLDDAAQYNRHFLNPAQPASTELELHECVFGTEPHSTRVMERIPSRDRPELAHVGGGA